MMYSDLASDDPRGGIEVRHRHGVRPSPPRVEWRVHRGKPLLLFWYAHADGEAVRDVARIETADDRVTRMQNYFFTPDVIAEICTEIGVPHHTKGYRYW